MYLNFKNWYTDSLIVSRNVAVKTGNLTRMERQPVYNNIPCRIYRENDRTIRMNNNASTLEQSMKIALALDYQVKEGDELVITRGGMLGHTDEVIRAFAGSPNKYYEPFGAVIPNLAHQEVLLLQQERVK